RTFAARAGRGHSRGVRLAALPRSVGRALRRALRGRLDPRRAHAKRGADVGRPPQGRDGALHATKIPRRGFASSRGDGATHAARTAGPDSAASTIGERSSGVPTQRNELAEDALVPRDAATDRRARIALCLAALLDNAPGHADALTTLARDLAEETSTGRFEVFF